MSNVQRPAALCTKVRHTCTGKEDAFSGITRCDFLAFLSAS